MALTYDLRNVKFPCTYVGEDDKVYMSPITETIIFSCMAVRIGEITEKNWAEWYARYVTWERVVIVDGRGITITAQNVYDHIGLKTNVFPEMSRTKWMREVLTPRIDSILSEAQRKVADLDKQVKEIQALL